MTTHDQAEGARALKPHILLDEEETRRYRAGDAETYAEIGRQAHDYLQSHHEIFVIHLYAADASYHGYFSLATLEAYRERAVTTGRGLTPGGEKHT